MPATKPPAAKSVGKTIGKAAAKPAAARAIPEAEKTIEKKSLAKPSAQTNTKTASTAAIKKELPNVTTKKPDVKQVAASSESKSERADLVADNNVTLPPNYKPSEKEDYMNPKMLAYFRSQLQRWKQDLLNDSSDTLESLSDGGMQEPDITDRATAETDRALEFRTRDRERKLIRKIDEALMRIETDDFGYCDETGEPIGIKRLMARPIATLTVEAQERHERQERTQRDEADE